MSINKLIILDFPPGFKFGIDLRVWTVGPNFKGVKNIPDGCHYIYYSAEEEASNTGFFVHLKNGQIVVKKWCKVAEDLIDYNCTEGDLIRFKENEGEIERYLGKYYMDNHKDWWSMSNHISDTIIESIMPDCGRINSVDQFISPQSSTADRLTTTTVKDADGLTELQLKAETVIKFVTVPKCLFPEGTTTKTKYALDKTFTLETVLNEREYTRNNPLTLLGELQFAFVTYNLSYQLSSLQHWLAIIDLLSSCTEAVTKYQPLYTGFLTVLYYQMKLTDEDFADITTNNNRFYNSMKRLFVTVLEEANITDDLKTRALGLKEFLAEKNEWDFDEEMDDEQPVLVELGEEDDEVAEGALMLLD